MTQNYSKGIALRILNSFIFTVMSFLLVVCSVNLDVLQVIFIRSIAGVCISFIVLKIMKHPIPIKIGWSSFIYFAIRSSISVVSTITWVFTIKQIGLNDATALGFIASMWMVISAILFLSEKLTAIIIVAIVLDTIAVVLILHPQVNNITAMGLGAAIFTTMLWAAYDTICKKQTATEHYLLQAFYGFAASAIISLPFAMYVWQPVTILDIVKSSTIGLLAFTNIIVLFMSYTYAPLVVLIPFSYTRLLFAVIFSYFLYGTIPTFGCLLGASIIVATDLYCYRSRALD